jgi:hypothetical protein
MPIVAKICDDLVFSKTDKMRLGKIKKINPLKKIGWKTPRMEFNKVIITLTRELTLIVLDGDP